MAKRACGVLLHPTSLPGAWGIGDLGRAALDFLDWLETAGQTIWQVLPTGPVGEGNSPYNALSSYAGNPWLIDPVALHECGLIAQEELAAAAIDSPARVPFSRVAEAKNRLFHRAHESYVRRSAGDGLVDAVRAWAASPEQVGWLDAWTLYAALKDSLGGSSWTEWPMALRQRHPEALAAARTRLAMEIDYQTFLQYFFFQQWNYLRSTARERGIALLGDLPFYVALDSCEVWLEPELFDLDDAGQPRHVGGVPPDYFSATGQRWGNPVYRWDRHAAEGYRWWVERLRHQLTQVDRLRLDHFRGFAAYWQIPADHETAVDGTWCPGPGKELFDAAETALGSLPFVAEDLGLITPDVDQLRRKLRLPGMRVLQFAFDGSDSPHLPHNLDRRTVFYTGTHDNDTAQGWFTSLDAASRIRVLEYLGGAAEEVHWSMMRSALCSVAQWVVVPVQDLAGFGGAHRMNTPGTADGNWAWRLPDHVLTTDLGIRLRTLTQLTGRVGTADA